MKKSKKHSTKQFDEAIKCHLAKKWQEAILLYREVIKEDPGNANVWGNLGSALKITGALEEAEYCLRHAIELNPSDYNHFYNLGNTLRELKKIDEAISAYRQALLINPLFSWAHYNLGLTFDEQGQVEEAMASYKEALKVDPQHYDANLNLGALYEAEGVLSKAISYYRAAIESDPNRAPAYNNLALALQNAGLPAEGLEMGQQALKLEPGQHRIASNTLMTLQYLPDVTNEMLLESAKTYGRRFSEARSLRPASARGRKLRIGYVSADFCSHPVGLFLYHVLERHDRENFEVYCYSNGGQRDEVTEVISATSQWRNIREASDEAVIQQIQEDGIDILIDLSGHTANNRLPVFALRTAPVQVSWLGYFATTGLPAMDFVILDPYHAPPGSETQFCERIIRLPHSRFCYHPVPFAPEVSGPPFLKNGFITFGSFNNTAKLNDKVLSSWASILQAVPNSHLILKWRTFADKSFCQRIKDFFRVQGIDAERIELRGVSVHRQLLEEYADIDIALDPFPFSGGHTSCEALWMGVPVVTLYLDRVVSRQTWCFLNNIGMPELAAGDVAGYVRMAVELANKTDALQELRKIIRDKMRTSSLCDDKNFTRLLEDAYREAWQSITGEMLSSPAQSSGSTLSPVAKAETLYQSAIQAWQQGNITGARQHLEAAIALNPEVAVYYADLGVMLKHLGLSEARMVCYQKAIELAPEEALYHNNLAGALNEAQRYVEGEAAARRAITLQPDGADAWFNLGSSLAGQERWADSAEAFDTAIKYRVKWSDASKAAGEAWRMLGNWKEAGKRFYAAWLSLPEDANADTKAALLNDIGFAYQCLYCFSDAEHYFRQALALKPDEVELLTNLGNNLKATAKFDEADRLYRRVLELRPDLAGGYCNLGTVEQSIGNYEEAIKCYRQALELAPQLREAWSNLGACLTYSPFHGPAEVLDAFEKFNLQIAQPLFDSRPHKNDRNLKRRLRIGYVSPDFRKHAVAYFALPLIEGHRKENVEVYCYYNHPQVDEWTERFRQAADHWFPCAGSSDESLAERIRTDGIDILIDLAGPTEGGRLLTFARKPAPVQVTWMGYVTTTGMNAMDWRITHVDADQEGTEIFYSEKLWRIPGTMWCYRPLSGMPDVSPPPVENKGYISFGSFNRYSKNSLLVLETWASILNQVPHSRLIICVPEGSIREQMMRFFADRGIEPGRISAFAKVSHNDFWKLHSEVDIALDPFPFGGGTTTCETLWLGVPLVTCTGKVGGDFAPRFASRMGYAFLNNLGLSELAAETVERYVEIAVNLANKPESLAVLRKTLRLRMANAPLTDEKRFVREMEEAYRTMWQQWCKQPSKINNQRDIKMKTFLHVGCGRKCKDQTTLGFNVPEWNELRLDIDIDVKPDIVGTMLDMSAVSDASVDAVYSSHNIEHLYPHEVSIALSEFKRVLKPEGFIVITCPDLQSVCSLIAEDKLTEPAYLSSAGPIAPLDILYGHRPAIAEGNLYMAHRCGFTQKVLIGTLREAGFSMVASKRRGHPNYDLWALAVLQPMTEDELRPLALAHFPK
ncbi:MAG: O-linked N-acetylglucosamine transferase family protein [Methylobacter sp.]